MNTAQASRVREIDAARGAAMAAVCISHSALYLSAHPEHQRILATIGMVATPSFLLLSGTVCGYLASKAREDVSQFRRRLIDRGLFLLIVAHLVIGLTNSAWAPLDDVLIGSVYITDAVGIGLIVAAFVARRLSSRQLLACGFALYLGACALTASIEPTSDHARFLARLFLGIGGGNWQQGGYVVPVLPYLAIFLIGLAGGREYGARRARGATLLQIARSCMWIGLACMTAAVCIKVLAVGAKPSLSVELHDDLWFLTDPRQKIPPGISYALAFGGAGVLGTAAIFAMSHFARGQLLIAALSTVGRASLITFVVQFWVYAYPARVLQIGDLGAWWPLAFAGSVGFLWLVAAGWDRANYNRFLTLGLRGRKTSRLPAEA
jgi:Predicted membrane protein